MSGRREDDTKGTQKRKKKKDSRSKPEGNDKIIIFLTSFSGSNQKQSDTSGREKKKLFSAGWSTFHNSIIESRGATTATTTLYRKTESESVGEGRKGGSAPHTHPSFDVKRSRGFHKIFRFVDEEKNETIGECEWMFCWASFSRFYALPIHWASNTKVIHNTNIGN